jgi:sterol desaturase/sphingolipid hydroxylase (fatty acid hydroxylase superfamily)
MVRDLVRWTLYPTLLFGALALTLLGLRAGLDPGLVVASVIILSPLPLLLAQRWIPAVPEWRGKPKDFGIDLLHMASTWGAAEASRAIVGGVATFGAVALQKVVGGHLWPTSWPLFLQFVFALLMGEFLAYWFHRACHETPLLWRIHAMHHSSERMYVFAAARNHPMNAFMMQVAHLLPLTLLGAPPEIIALTASFHGVHGLLQHCNVDLRHGVFNYVFSTADLHRWHHSAVLEESNSNFGNNLIVWDWLFGTRHSPEGRPAAVGLGDRRLPENFFVHLASPFVLYRVLTGQEPAPALDPVVATVAPPDGQG